METNGKENLTRQAYPESIRIRHKEFVADSLLYAFLGAKKQTEKRTKDETSKTWTKQGEDKDEDKAGLGQRKTWIKQLLDEARLGQSNTWTKGEKGSVSTALIASIYKGKAITHVH
jgi:hypothetical protein